MKNIFMTAIALITISQSATANFFDYSVMYERDFNFRTFKNDTGCGFHMWQMKPNEWPHFHVFYNAKDENANVNEYVMMRAGNQGGGEDNWSQLKGVMEINYITIYNTDYEAQGLSMDFTKMGLVFEKESFECSNMFLTNEELR